MALLGTYGGADDVRIYQNRILAEQAGALVPEGGGGEGELKYTRPVPLEPAVISRTIDPDPAVMDEWVVNLTSLGTLAYDKEFTKVDLEYWYSVVGGQTSNNTLVMSIQDIDTGDLAEKTTFRTQDHNGITRPCVMYGKIIYTHPDSTQPSTSVTTAFYTEGVVVPAVSVVLAKAATTRSKKVTTA